MQVLIPMSGQGVRFQKAGYLDPKPLVKVGGKPMIECLLESIPIDWPCTFVLADNHKDTQLPTLLKNLRPTSKIIYVPINQTGPWLALTLAAPLLDTTDSVLVSYCDYGLKWSPSDFKNFVTDTQCDACLLSYRGFHAHYLSPLTYAYSRLEGDFVKEVKEKGSFTDNRENEYASCGAYYFKNPKDLIEALEYQKEQNLQIQDEFYTSLTVEALLRMKPQTNCRVYEIEEFYQWGTPEDLESFEYWQKTYSQQNKNSNLSQTSICSQILMPMAGEGSRLKKISPLPKPLVPIDGTPLYRKALNTFPKAQKNIFIALSSIKDQIDLKPQDKIISTEKTPNGQALTTELGLSLLDNGDVIVTACDHGIVLAKEKWESFISQPDCDAAIFTIKGYPGSRRSATSYSYAQLDVAPHAFPKVSEVGLKKPFTDQPEKEPLVVGSFWFRSKDVLKVGLDELKKNRQDSSHEIFLDEVFNFLMDLGFTVRSISLEGYINWGDADSFKESAYWKNIFKVAP